MLLQLKNQLQPATSLFHLQVPNFSYNTVHNLLHLVEFMPQISISFIAQLHHCRRIGLGLLIRTKGTKQYGQSRRPEGYSVLLALAIELDFLSASDLILNFNINLFDSKFTFCAFFDTSLISLALQTPFSGL